jgi:hypothetical protein
MRSQPCAIRIAHLREEQQKIKVATLRNEGCTVRTFSERRAPAPRARDFFFNGLAMKNYESREVGRGRDCASPLKGLGGKERGRREEKVARKVPFSLASATLR